MELDMTLLQDLAIEWGGKILAALLIFFIGRYIAMKINVLIRRGLEKTGMESMLVSFLSNLCYTIMLVAVALAAMQSLDIPITSLLAIVGAAGLAVGLALKDSLSNFAAGMMIIIFRPFKIGDFITAGGVSGVVDEIGMFCTMMHTGDNQRIIQPNSAIINGTIINTSALPTRRIDLLIGISYDDNIGKARDIINAVISSDERVLADPAPVIAVHELADSSVNLVVRPWVNSGDYWPARWDLTEKIKIALDEAGITIPYPQQDVYMHTVEKA